MTQPSNLCSTTDVQRVIDTTGRWTGTTVSNKIVSIQNDIFDECGYPLKAIYSPVTELNSVVQRRFYVGEPKIYKVDRVFYGTYSKTELFESTGWKASTTYGMIRLLTVASGGVTPDTDSEVEIWFSPKIYNELATYRTAKALAEQLDVTSGGKSSKELEVIKNELAEVERRFINKFGLQVSSQVENYDSKYGINRRLIYQDNSRNQYLGSSGW